MLKEFVVTGHATITTPFHFVVKAADAATGKALAKILGETARAIAVQMAIQFQEVKCDPGGLRTVVEIDDRVMGA
jgi:hypothetical protein